MFSNLLYRESYTTRPERKVAKNRHRM